MGIAVEPYIKVKNAIMAAQGRGDDVALSASWAFTGWLLALAHLLLLPLPLSRPLALTPGYFPSVLPSSLVYVCLTAPSVYLLPFSALWFLSYHLSLVSLSVYLPCLLFSVL